MTTTAKPKRVRLTDGCVRRWMKFQGTIAAEWARTVREQRSHHATFTALSERIHALDVTNECKRELAARNWGARDLVEALHAEWCLYLDGKRTTTSEAFALGRHNDMCGRFEWRGTGKPFYTDEAPQPLTESRDA